MPIHEQIQPDFDVFTHDGEKSVGAVRQVHAHGIVIYIENAGDFEVPISAVLDAHSEKVILDPARLEPRLRQAIARAHSGEDPNIP
jgi:hypothetical protein